MNLIVVNNEILKINLISSYSKCTWNNVIFIV